VRAQYLNKIPFGEALRLEQEAFARVLAGGQNEVLAFETDPVITLGVRGSAEDLRWSPEEIERRGFRVHHLERGGQATLHNPGQLVIFPIVNIRHIGARVWVQMLMDVTQWTLHDWGKEARCRQGRPGLFTNIGKIMAVGIRVHQGVSTHGVSINVSNDLADFAGIRPCGVAGAPVDRIGTSVSLEAVFSDWLRNFTRGLTMPQNLTNLECSSLDVRL